MNQIVAAVGSPIEPPRSRQEARAPLNFIRRQDTKPVFHSAAFTGGEMKLFFDVEAHTVAIADMREIADPLSVDRQGFERSLTPYRSIAKDSNCCASRRKSAIFTTTRR